MRYLPCFLFIAGCASSSPQPELEIEPSDACAGVRFRDEVGEPADAPADMSGPVGVDHDDIYVYAYLASGGSVVRFELGDSFMGKVDAKVTRLNDRYTAVTAQVEHFGRTEGEGCDDPEGCPSATYTAGFIEHDAVIDVQAGRLVWVRTEAIESEGVAEPLSPCDGWGKVGFDGETFTSGSCDGGESFTLDDIAPCRLD